MSDETLIPHQAETRASAGYSVAARISKEIVKLISSYTGRGPTKARTTLNTNVATVLLEDTLTRGEQQLVRAGEYDSVRRQRAIFHRLMREDAVAAVERATGRTVSAYLSDVAPEADVAMLAFVFDQRGDRRGQRRRGKGKRREPRFLRASARCSRQPAVVDAAPLPAYARVWERTVGSQPPLRR